MSRSHYSLNKDQAFTIRGTAKLLNAASAKYGGDWHSVPHTHTHAELFYIDGVEVILDEELALATDNIK